MNLMTPPNERMTDWIMGIFIIMLFIAALNGWLPKNPEELRRMFGW